MVAHGDNFATGAMIMQTELSTSSGAVGLVVPASEHAQIVSLAGRRSSSAAHRSARRSRCRTFRRPPRRAHDGAGVGRNGHLATSRCTSR